MEDISPRSFDAESQDSLQQEVRRLQQLFVLTLVILIGFVACVDFFMWRQVSHARKDVETLRPQVTALSAEYNKTADPLIKSLVASLQNFAKTHPDFNVILAKYNLQATPAIAPAPAVTTPAPATAPKK